MLLLQAPEEPLRQLLAGRSDWVIATETGYPIPDTRKKVNQPPDANK
jgi:hypothetical protein